MTAPARVIHEDEHLLVVHRPGASDFTLVTFGGMGQRPDGTWLWGERPVRVLGLEAIGFLGKRPNWYPAASMRSAAPAVRAALRGAAIGYGYSMGGYAALKYGALLGLRAALAVAPQVSIDPGDVPRDARYHGFFDPALHAGMRVGPGDLSPCAVVVADPRFPLDRMHADVPDLAPYLHRIWLPYRRHGVIHALTGSRVLGEALDLLRAGDVGGLHAMLRARRRTSWPWYDALATAAAQRGRLAWAEHLWERAIEHGLPRPAAEQHRDRAEQDRDRRFPVAWRPAATRAMTMRLLAQSRAGNWRGVGRSVARLPPCPTPPRLALAVTNAAIARGDGRAIAEAAAWAIAADLPPGARVAAAERLAATAHGLPALTVLLADPALAADGATQARAAPVLGRVLRDEALDPMWRAVAETLRRRLIAAGPAAAEAPPPPEPSPFRFAPAAPPRPAPPRWIGAAPRLPRTVLAEFRAVLAAPFVVRAGLEAPSVALLRDVFVNARGQVWDREGRPHRSLGLPVAEASRAAMATAPEIGEAAFGVEPHRNFYHWIIDTLTGLAWRLDLGPGGMPVLLREGAPAYVRESLDIAAGGPVPVDEAGPAVFVRRLHLATAGLRHLAPRGAHAGIIARIAAAARQEAPDPARRLYISRRDSPARRLLNEAEVEEALATRGFHCTTFGGVPLRRQVALLMGAEAIAAPHGAGLSHLLFCEPGRQVFELMPASPGQLELRACFSTISRLRGHRHGLWLEPFNETFGEWRVDLARMLPALDAFLDGAAGAGASPAPAA